MSSVNIRGALITAMESLSLSYPVIYPNSPVTAPLDSPWLRFTMSDIGDSVETLGDEGYNQNIGTLQIDVFTPKLSSDLLNYQIIEEVRQVFKSGALLSYGGQYVRILSASVGKSASEQTWFGQYLLVTYRTFTQRN